MKSGWIFVVAAFLALIIAVGGLTEHIADQNVTLEALGQYIEVKDARIASLKLDLDAASRTQLPATFIVDQRPKTVEQCFRIGDWDYIVMTFNPGTRSEGHNSILTNQKGHEVLPDDLTDRTATIETPWGLMRWQGHINDRQHAWNNSGWRLEGVCDDE